MTAAVALHGVSCLFGSGAQTVRSTVLPPGDYDCAIVVAAFSHGAFGPTYDSSVSIGGKKVATAQGSVATGQDERHPRELRQRLFFEAMMRVLDRELPGYAE